MSNSSEVIDYVYYANNFSNADAPNGVIPKYLFIVMPGVAYLYNSMPERTHHNDPYNVWVALIQFVLSTIGLSVHGFSIWTVLMNKSLSCSVKWFLLSDAGIHLFNYLVAFYQIECMFSWSCVDPSGYPISWLLLNQIVSTFKAALPHSIVLLALGLSVNRVFAIYFDGLYYDKAQKMAIPCVLFAFALPEGLYLPFIGTRRFFSIPFAHIVFLILSKTIRLGRGVLTHVLGYTGFFYTPLQYMGLLIGATPFAGWVLTLLPWFGYLWVGMALLLDLCTLWRVRRMKKASSNSKSRADFKLSVMTTCSVLVIIAELLTFQLNTVYLDAAEPFILFLFNLPEFIFPLVSGAVVAAFNYERKKSGPLFTRRPVVNSAAVSSPQTGTTKLD